MSVYQIKAQIEDHYAKLSPERVLFQTDKSVYKPGESIWFSARVLSEADFRYSHISEILHVELIDPAGVTTKKLKVILKGGAAGGDIFLDEFIRPGPYILRAYTNWQKNEAGDVAYEKKLVIQRQVNTSHKVNIRFDRENYLPGERVKVSLKMRHLDNRAATLKRFDYAIKLAGQVISQNWSLTDTGGKAEFDFQIPVEVPAGDLIMEVIPGFNSGNYPWLFKVPLQNYNNVKVTFFPESGSLVAGIESKVVFKTVDARGDLVEEVEGFVMTTDSMPAGLLEKFPQVKGIGAFNLTPKPGRQYMIRITKPVIPDSFVLLPPVLQEGYGIRLLHASDGSIDFNVHSTFEDKVHVLFLLRKKVFFSRDVQLSIEGENINIPVQNLPTGLGKILLIDREGKLQAVRRVFINNGKKLHLDIFQDKEKYKPRDKVELEISAENERGKPVIADLSVAVTDLNQTAPVKEYAREIFSQLFIEPELNNTLTDPDFYFNETDNKSLDALDNFIIAHSDGLAGWGQIFDKKNRELIYDADKTTIKGRVIDERGRPLRDATMEIAGQEGIIKMNSKGEFVIEGLDLCTTKELIVRRKKKETIYPLIEYKQDIEIVVGTTYEPVDSSSGGVVKGRITDAETGEPVALVKVNLYENRRLIDVANTDLNGNYIFRNLLSSSYQVEVVHSQYAPQMITAVSVSNHYASVVDVILAARSFADTLIIQDYEVPLIDQDLNLEEVKEKQLPDFSNDPRYIFYDTLNTMSNRKNQLIRNVKGDISPTVKYHLSVEFPVFIPENKYYGERPGVENFRRTIFWEPGVKTENSGKRHVAFFNSDAVSEFSVVVTGISSEGIPGSTVYYYKTECPYTVTAAVPRKIFTGDRVNIPVKVINHTDKILKADIRLEMPENLILLNKIENGLRIPPKDTLTLYAAVEAMEEPGKEKFSIRLNAEGIDEEKKYDIHIVTKSLQDAISFSGRSVKKDHRFEVKDLIRGTIQADLKIYPSFYSELYDAIDYVKHYPYNPFEKTAATLYLSSLMLNRLIDDKNRSEELVNFARREIDSCMEMISRYQTLDKGFDYITGNHANEMLTAYMLMVFTDLRSSYDRWGRGFKMDLKDLALEWKDHKGSFILRNTSEQLHANPGSEVANGFLTFVLAGSGYETLGREMDHIYGAAVKSQDPYLLALAANAMLILKDKQRASKLQELLLRKQRNDGSWESKLHTYTKATGIALKLETTALCLMALMDLGKARENVERGIDLLYENKSGNGGFISPQTTVWVMKALNRYYSNNNFKKQSGRCVVYVDRKVIAKQDIDQSDIRPVVINDFTKHIKGGRQRVRIKLEGLKMPVPYAAQIGWASGSTVQQQEKSVQLQVEIDTADFVVGDSVDVAVTLSNLTGKSKALSMVVINIPYGLDFNTDYLDQLVKEGTICFYEMLNEQVVLYFRQFSPDQKVDILMKAEAGIPGEFVSLPSWFCSFYDMSEKYWSAGSKVNIISNEVVENRR